MKLTVFPILTAIVSLFGLINLCITAGYNEVCNGNSYCKEANTFCEFSFSRTCKKGKCKCLQHMVWDESDMKCKVKKYNVDKCNMNLTSCQGGTECNGKVAQCKCKGNNTRFYASLKKCVDSPSPWKVIGEDCTDIDDCYREIPDAVECVVPNGSTESQKKCACASGYIEHKSTCRKPHLGELCSVSVGCAQEIEFTEDSVVTETCSSETPSRCTCPTASTNISIEQDGRSAYVCMTIAKVKLLPEGKLCSLHNRCESFHCIMCPGESKKKCVVKLIKNGLFAKRLSPVL